jgi:hypothetical protein
MDGASVKVFGVAAENRARGLPDVPTDLKMGHSGLGSVSHLTCLLYFQLISVEPTIVHNPLRRSGGFGPMVAVRVGEDVVFLT